MDLSKITRSCMMQTEMKSVIFIFSESLLRFVCGKEFQDRIFCKPLVGYILSDDVTASTITVQLNDVPVFEAKEKLEAI